MRTEEYNKRINELSDEIKSLQQERDAMTTEQIADKLKEYEGMFLGKCFHEQYYKGEDWYKIMKVLRMYKKQNGRDAISALVNKVEVRSYGTPEDDSIRLHYMEWNDFEVISLSAHLDEKNTFYDKVDEAAKLIKGEL